MDIEFRKAHLLLVGSVLRPDRTVGKVEPLIRGEAVDQADVLAGDGVPHRRVGDAESAVVSDVLTEGELAVGVYARHDLNLVELGHKHLGLGVELLGILRRPPVGHIPVLVEESALVVESVGHLVTDHDSDSAVVDGVVRVSVEERRLEDRRREADLVRRRVIVGVDCLRRHSPFGLVGRLAEFGHIVGRVPGSGCAEILVVALLRVDVKGRVILPLVRIANLHGEVVQLLVGLGLCGVAHPIKFIDVLAERLLEVLHEIDHLCLRGLREVFGHVHLADSLAEDAVRNLHSPLPARFLLLDAGHLGAEEIE